jgi:hypothetical protein
VFAVEQLVSTDLRRQVSQACTAQGAALRRNHESVHHRHVGRTSVLQSILDKVSALVLSNQSGLVMIKGESGFGKSCLVQHLLEEDELGGLRTRCHIFHAAGTPEFRPIPLTPWKVIMVVRKFLAISTLDEGQVE